tara:strand:- start:488 stop:652 length:165 start_codon:yes stop_codon:yes gene_type:complete
MTEKLFESLRVVFGPRSTYNTEVKTWAQTEYGTDWRWAYEMINKGKTPIRGIDY